MAERRMFSKSVINSDLFLDMSYGARALYLTLCVNADDDGFISNAKSLMRMAGCNEEYLNELLENGFAIRFNSGVLVIRHWRISNSIRKDRYTPTNCVDELKNIRLNEYTNVYDKLD